MKSTELILNADGSIYHLNLLPEDIGHTIILVGDPARVDRIAATFEHIELTKEKREFRTMTGSLNGNRVSVISTGIGTDNIDIVLNELDALINIDFSSRTVKEQITSLKIIRMGTCGGLREEFEPGTLVLSTAAIGLDGMMPFYVTTQPGISQIEGAARKVLGDTPMIASLVYAAKADSVLCSLAAEKFSHIQQGITFTAPGFYGPQGRSLGRVPVRIEGLPDRIATIRSEGKSVLNMEMETSGILGLGAAMGHQCGSLSVVLANRPTGEFHNDPHGAVDHLIEVGIELVKSWMA